MKRFSCLLLVVLLAACAREEYLVRGQQAAGDVSGADIVTDEGIRFRVLEQTCEGKLDTMSRVFITCDILRKNAGNSYDIRLTRLRQPLVKDARRVSSLEEGEVLSVDPVGIDNAWLGGGYLNMHFSVAMDPEHPTVHKINLLWDDTAPADTIRLTLCHDDQLPPAAADAVLTKGQGSACFPLSSFTPPGGEKLPVTLSWNDGESHVSHSRMKK